MANKVYIEEYVKILSQGLSNAVNTGLEVLGFEKAIEDLDVEASDSISTLELVSEEIGAFTYLNSNKKTFIDMDGICKLYIEKLSENYIEDILKQYPFGDLHQFNFSVKDLNFLQTKAEGLKVFVRMSLQISKKN